MDTQPDRRTFPPAPAVLSAVLVTGLAYYLAQVLGWYNGDVVTFQRYWDRFLYLHTLPLEYPPAALAVFALAAVPHLAWPIPVFAAWMAIPALAGYLACWRFSGPRAAFAYLALLAAGSLSVMLTRYDLVPSLLVLAALWAAQRGRWPAAYLLIAAGTLLKLYPLALAPVFLCAQLAGGAGTGRAARSVAPGLLLLAAGIAIPLAVYGPSSLAFATGFLVQRPAELESLPAVTAWALGGGATRFDFGQVGFAGRYSALTAGLFLAVLAATYLGILFRARRGSLGLGPAAVLTVAAILAFSKILSAQYLLWLLPLVAVEEGLAPAWIAVAALTTLAYPFLWAGAPGAAAPLMLAILARDGLLAGIVLRRSGAGALGRRLAGLAWTGGRRRLLAAAAGLALVEVIAGEAVALVATALGPLHSPDFIAYYTAGTIAARGQGARLYDLAEQTAVQAGLTAGWGGHRFLLAWANPPQDALLLAPLAAALPYRPAYAAWLLLQAMALVAAVALLVRAERIRGAAAWLAGMAGLATLPAFVTLLQGQADGFSLLGLALLRLDWRRPGWRAGVGLALVLLKPHLAAVGLLLLVARRSAWPALGTALALTAAAAGLAFGPRVWVAWAGLVVPTGSGAAEGWVTGHEDHLALGGQLEALGASALAATVVCGLLALLVLALLLLDREAPAALAVAVTASVLLSPHVNIHDFVLLLAPAMAVLGALAARPAAWPAVALLAAAAAVDAALAVNPGVVVAGVCALLGAALWAWLEPVGEPGPEAAGAIASAAPAAAPAAAGGRG